MTLGVRLGNAIPINAQLRPQETPEEEPGEAEPVIQPGGDPDAGMPAEQAEIHGTERGPAPEAEPSHAPKDGHAHTPPAEEGDRDPPVTDSLDNIDDDVIDPGETPPDNSNVTHPPDSD